MGPCGARTAGRPEAQRVGCRARETAWVISFQEANGGRRREGGSQVIGRANAVMAWPTRGVGKRPFHFHYSRWHNPSANHEGGARHWEIRPVIPSLRSRASSERSEGSG